MPELIAPRGGHLHLPPLHSLPFVDLFASTTPFYTPRSPQSEVDSVSDIPAHLVTDRDLNDDDDDDHNDNPVAPHTISALTATSADSCTTTTTCIVCMDSDKDIALAPCNHSHCCLACFRRSHTHTCPICRAPVSSIVILSTGMHLPLSLVVPKPLGDRPVHTRSSVSFRDQAQHEPSNYLYSRRSMPSLIVAGHDDDTSSIRSRTTSMSSVNVARQAASSVRTLPRERDAAFRQLRQTGSVHPPTFVPVPTAPALQRHNTIPSTTSTVVTVSEASNQVVNVTATEEPSNHRSQNIVLIGHNKKVLISLAKRLLAIFPPEDCHDIATKSKSTVYINGEAIRLVLIMCPMFSIGPEFVMRVQRHSPKLVLLCADYFNVSSFESIVRLDMELLDYLNIACIWVLVKSTNCPKESNIVEEADVKVAKHFLSRPRRCFIAPVDSVFQNVAMRKLGLYIYRSVTRNTPSSRAPPNLDDKPTRGPPRSLSFFCLRPEKNSRKKPREASRSTTNLARWLW